MRAVASIFPVYDIAKSVSGGRVGVTMLVPPGAETHDFEPTPGQAISVQKADFFLFAGPTLEPWANSFLKATAGKKTMVVDASAGANVIYGDSGAGSGAPSSADPHIWLDFDNASKMADNIAEGFAIGDADHSDSYKKNASTLKGLFSALDAKYKSALGVCKKRTLVHGGHYSLGYIAARYGLRYESAVQSMKDAEPSPARVAALVGIIRKVGIKFVFYDEPANKSLAEAIATESGARTLKINAMHNVTKEEFEHGVSFVQLLEINLERLREGLECPR
ncbi:MAG: zinc ABC transporter substrate-binding protein [Nitrospinae bacterium]|nr:zinc ABC transporter substrate-binding protein [Nitrospinota bacterium]